MTDVIRLLPDSVANQIAAGEVIQRPASCLKELVENALDAGATNIRVIVRDAGRTLLQVVDNGKGMSPTDARMAFERHATSKIREAQDLFHLTTMGFRGEALASICAVAQVEVQTRRAEDEMGTLLEIDGSQVVRQEPVQCPVGTNMRVKNLFYNVPARRRFLKTDQTELRNLLTDYQRIVLVYPQVQFTFVSNDEILSELPSGSTKQRIESVFGRHSKTYTAQFVDVNVQTELVTINGFVGKPEYANRNTQQYMFVNGRYMRHPYFHKAVMNAYSGLLAADSQPSYYLYFDVDPQRIDVNIHPTKTEIKFADEQAVFQILVASIREALGKFNIAPTIDFSSSQPLNIPAANDSRLQRPVSAPKLTVDPHYNPFMSSAVKSQPKGWEVLYEPKDHAATQPERIPDIEPDALTDHTTLVQWMDKYILWPNEKGLVCIHQHRAHTYLLFKDLMNQITKQPGVVQPLLFPELLTLTDEEAYTFHSVMEDLTRVGFTFEETAEQSYSITGVPALLGQKNPVETILNLLHRLDANPDTMQQQWQEQVALTLAEQMAITAGQHLTDVQMRDIVKRLLSDGNLHRFLPDGRVVLVALSEENMERMFQK